MTNSNDASNSKSASGLVGRVVSDAPDDPMVFGGQECLPIDIDKMDIIISKLRRKMIAHDSELEMLKVFF